MTSDLVAEARARAHTLDDPLDTALLLALADQAEAQTEEINLLRARSPRAYIMTRAAEWIRLFREVHGYLRTCHKHHGTDWAGRKHAMDALEKELVGFENALLPPDEARAAQVSRLPTLSSASTSERPLSEGTE